MKVKRLRPVGVYRQVGDGDPSPPCQYPSCPRRALMAYRGRKTGKRIFRPWCRVHRGRIVPVVARPRPYLSDPDAWRWPPELKCPFCDNKRVQRKKGDYRKTCRRHLDQSHLVVEPSKPKPIKVVKAKVVRVKKPVRVPIPKPGVTENPLRISFKDGKHFHKIDMTPYDAIRLRQLFKEDAGHYPAATDSKLSRKYPTAAIAVLWNRWSQEE